MAAYRDPTWRASTWEELSGANGGILPFNWPSVSVAESAADPSWWAARLSSWPPSGDARPST